MNQLKNPQRWRNAPIITYSIIFINLMVYLWMMIRFGTTESSRALLIAGANFRPLIVLNHEWWRLFTAGFIHIGIEHLVMNLLSIYFVGMELESIMGRWRFIVVYIISILGGNILSFALASSGSLSAGASTGIFGLFTAYIVLGRLYPESPYLKMRAQSFKLLLILNVVLNIFSGTVDNWGHLGGAIFGALMTAILGIRYRSNQISVKHRILTFILMVILFIACLFIGLNRAI